MSAKHCSQCQQPLRKRGAVQAGARDTECCAAAVREGVLSCIERSGYSSVGREKTGPGRSLALSSGLGLLLHQLSHAVLQSLAGLSAASLPFAKAASNVSEPSRPVRGGAGHAMGGHSSRCTGGRTARSGQASRLNMHPAVLEGVEFELLHHLRNRGRKASASDATRRDVAPQEEARQEGRTESGGCDPRDGCSQRPVHFQGANGGEKRKRKRTRGEG
eukprot:6206299-Pleurochrysis_carterae.AAC.4